MVMTMVMAMATFFCVLLVRLFFVPVSFGKCFCQILKIASQQKRKNITQARAEKKTWKTLPWPLPLAWPWS